MQITESWRRRLPDRGTGLRGAYRFLVTRWLRSRYLGDVVGVPEMSADSEFALVRTTICAAGTDSLSHFENGYTHEGGLFLQQNPDEFAALLRFLGQRGPFRTYLEIGSASGGACLLIHRNVGFDHGLSIDDGQHPRAVEQDKNFALIPSLKRFTGDSHSVEARAFLESTLGDRKVDLAFIDGDHSRNGIRQDIELVLPFCRPHTLLVLHDTRACAGVEWAWLDAVRHRTVTPLAEFAGILRPLGIGVGEVSAA